MLYNIMPENLYPQLPTPPPISQESFNIEMVRKYYQEIANLKEKYTDNCQVIPDSQGDIKLGHKTR